jgi:hypothetical protein
MRNTFSADPHSPRQPQPAYYVMRNLCTVLDGVKPADFPIQLFTEKNARSYALQSPQHKVVAVWLTGQITDGDPAVPCDITLPGQTVSQAVGIDIINGTEQTLQVTNVDGQATLKSILLKDWPLLIRLIP